MTYQKDQTGIRQTAVNAAAALTVAEVSAGIVKSHDTVVKRFGELRDEVFTDLKVKLDEDNEMFKAEEAADEAAGRGKSKRRSSGGGSRSKGGSDDADPGATVINGKGKFAGLTIADVFELTAEQAGEYGYTDKDGNAKTGAQYIDWMAGNEKNPFMARKATAFLEAKRASSDAA